MINVERQSADRYEEAARWVTRFEALEAEMPLSAEEEREWGAFSADPANIAAFDRVAATLRDVRNLSHPPWPSNEELRAIERPSSARVPSWRPWAAAAFIASVAVATWGFLHGHSLSGTQARWATGPAEHRSVALPDGSEMVLGAASVVSADFSGPGRTLVLERGEALFRVRHDAARAFVVHAARGTVTATGTAFQVLSQPDRVVVTVTEGTVAVAPLSAASLTVAAARASPAPTPTRLSAGQQLSYADDGTVSAIEPADPQIATAWSRGTLIYRHRPLSEVVEDLQRYTAVQLSVDAGAGTIPITATISERDVGSWLQALPTVFPVTVASPDADHVAIRAREEVRSQKK